MDHLDKQMQQWSSRLRDDLKILAPASLQLATTISREVTALSPESKQHVRDASPIPLAIRLEELRAFQGWMDLVNNTGHSHPVVVRAQVITQNYICFVYLAEACFKVLKNEVQAGTTTKRCCKFLTDNPVRAFRNAVAHSNWRYLQDFSGLKFWAKKGDDPTEKPTRFEVAQQELAFWQSLARCTAYAAYLSL
jgi:hypothetical protein